MSKLFKFLTVAITIFAFVRMLKPGMYSTQDFHLFRLFEFDKCVKVLQIPCRWAPDAGLGYGEPLFNFYGQGAYAFGEIFHLAGFSFINSIKTLFIISLVGSAFTMFLLAKNLWKNDYSALLSAVLYIYTPYRAVDVWVRGALPEALSFVLFPLILLAIENKKVKTFALFFALLIITHNLSALMFLPVIIVWIIYKKFWRGAIGGILAILLSSFYILPVIFESKFIDLTSTITGYFDYHNHFVTIRELLISNFWGYGASVWGPKDDLSLAIGYLVWVIPILILAAIIVRRDILNHKEFLLLFIVGWIFLFLTHNKSTIIWEHLPFMAYVQFPWRFIGVATFCFSLAAGLLPKLFKKYELIITSVVCFLAILLTFNFFREDIWYKVGDNYYLTAAEWDRQRSASILDFWPKNSKNIPDKPSDGTHINYFPGWTGGSLNENNMIPSLGTTFKDTPVRKLGNILSLLTFFSIVYFSVKSKYGKKNI